MKKNSAYGLGIIQLKNRNENFGGYGILKACQPFHSFDGKFLRVWQQVGVNVESERYRGIRREVESEGKLAAKLQSEEHELHIRHMSAGYVCDAKRSPYRFEADGANVALWKSSPNLCM